MKFKIEKVNSFSVLNLWNKWFCKWNLEMIDWPFSLGFKEKASEIPQFYSADLLIWGDLQSGLLAFFQGVMHDKLKIRKTFEISVLIFFTLNAGIINLPISTLINSPEHLCGVIWANPDLLNCYSCQSYSLCQWPLPQWPCRGLCLAWAKDHFQEVAQIQLSCFRR